MKLHNLHEAKADKSFTMDEHRIMVVHRLKDGMVEPDVAEYKHKVNGIVIQDLGLTSLKGLPKIIRGNLLVSDNALTSLADGPDEIHGTLDISRNPVSSLEGIAPKIASLHAIDTKIDSLRNIHKHIKEFIPYVHNQFSMIANKHSKSGGVYNSGSLTFSDKSIKSNILGCLLIPNFDTVSFCYESKGPYYEAMIMVNTFLMDKGLSAPVPTRALLDLQDDMIDKGLQEWAQL